MKRFLLFALCVILLCSVPIGCVNSSSSLYSATFYDVFDTVTILKGYALSQSQFDQIADSVHKELKEYHTLYDIYHDANGINNLKTVNDLAGSDPVTVDRKIIDLLLFCRDVDSFTDHKVNVMLGAVLSLWHEARNTALDDPSRAYLPSMEDLTEAAKHVEFSLLEIDEAASTVCILDSKARLDVGAVAKGFTAQRVVEQLPEGYMLSLGGNIAVKGKKPDGSIWNVGVQDPEDSASLLHVVSVTDVSVVTSGDYQRSFTYEGKQYHHIIDPDTLYPSLYWKSVTVISKSSAIGDALSTALFLTDRETGMQLLKKFGAEAMWVGLDGSMYYTDGFTSQIKKQ